MFQKLKYFEYLVYLVKCLKYKPPMEDDFKKIQEAGIRSVDELIKWVTDAKLVDQAKETQDKMEKLFADAADQSQVEFSKFQQVMEAMAKEKKEDLEAMQERLANALRDGVQAFAASLEESKKK